jgi:hypothetical protein
MVATVAVCLIAAASAAAQPPGEFGNSGWVAGRVVYLECPKVETAPCVRRPIPKRMWNNASGAAVKGRHDQQRGGPNDALNADQPRSRNAYQSRDGRAAGRSAPVHV